MKRINKHPSVGWAKLAAASIGAFAVLLAASVASSSATETSYWEPLNAGFESNAAPFEFKIGPNAAIQCPSVQIPRVKISTEQYYRALIKSKLTFAQPCTSRNLTSMTFTGIGTSGGALTAALGSTTVVSYEPSEYRPEHRLFEFVSGGCTVSVIVGEGIIGQWQNGHVAGFKTPFEKSTWTFAEAPAPAFASAGCSAIVKSELAANQGYMRLNGKFIFSITEGPEQQPVIVHAVH